MRMRRTIISILSAMALFSAIACTSALVGGKVTKNGRPLLWKNRDTGTLDNFIARVLPSTADEMEYIGLFNAGDSTLSEAWLGMNRAGFAIINTASYNLAPDTARLKDREGVVMAEALKRCRNVDDFASLLDKMPRPMGVQANFGVMDANGGGGYFEVDDHNYQFYPLSDEPSGVQIRTNYSQSGAEDEGMGYIRYRNAETLLAPHINNKDITPATLTDTLSCSFYHSLLGRDVTCDSARWIVDQDFIPRHSTSATIVIEGVRAGEDVSGMTMWVGLGYPPVATVKRVTFESLPPELEPGADWHSAECDAAMQRKEKIFPIHAGSGQRYIDLDALKTALRMRDASVDE